MLANGGRDWIDYTTLAFTIGGVLIVGAYTIVTYLQVLLTREALAETRKSNQATEESNRLTSESNRAQREAMIAINRGHLFLGSIPDNPPIVGPASLRMSLGHRGACPATNIVGRFGWSLAKKPLTEMVPREQLPLMMSRPSMLQHYAGIDIGEGFALTDTESREVAEGRLFLYFSGSFTYDDGMGVSRETRICFRYRPDTQGWEYAPFGNSET